MHRSMKLQNKKKKMNCNDLSAAGEKNDSRKNCKEMTQRDAMPAECNLFIDEHVFRFYRPAAYRLIPDMVILYFI